MNADLIDALIAPGGVVGSATPDWPYSDDFAFQRVKLGASLTLLVDAEGHVLRYTLHHIGEPYKLTVQTGRALLGGLPLKLCWSVDHVGKQPLNGLTLRLYQYDQDQEPDQD